MSAPQQSSKSSDPAKSAGKNRRNRSKGSNPQGQSNASDATQSSAFGANQFVTNAKIGNGQSWPVFIKNLIDSCARAQLHTVAQSIEDGTYPQHHQKELQQLQDNSRQASEAFDRVKFASEASAPWEGNEAAWYEPYKQELNSYFHAYFSSERFTSTVKRAYSLDDITGKINLKLTEILSRFHACPRSEEYQRLVWQEFIDFIKSTLPQVTDLLEPFRPYVPSQVTQFHSNIIKFKMQLSPLAANIPIAQSLVTAKLSEINKYNETACAQFDKVFSALLLDNIITDPSYRSGLVHKEEIKELRRNHDVLGLLNVIKNQYDPTFNSVDIGAKLLAWQKMEPKKGESFSDFWSRWVKEKLECVSAGCTMPDEALSIQHIQDIMTKKYEDPSEKFITRIIERQLLPPTNPDHREPPETAEQFKESIYDLIRARNKANPAKRNVDPNLAYRGKDSKGDDPNASKNKKSDNDATTPSSKVVDEVDEEAVGAVTGSKPGNKQQQQKKQESGNKPPCGVVLL